MEYSIHFISHERSIFLFYFFLLLMPNLNYLIIFNVKKTNAKFKAFDSGKRNEYF